MPVTHAIPNVDHEAQPLGHRLDAVVRSQISSCSTLLWLSFSSNGKVENAALRIFDYLQVDNCFSPIVSIFSEKFLGVTNDLLYR